MRALLLISACVLAACSPSEATMNLATDGATAYRVVVDPEATAPEKHAAQELAKFLTEVTGAEFPVAEATSAGFEPALIVGPGRAARAVAPDLDLDNLRPDGYVLETRAPHLILAGDRPRGTLYAVYSFLEDTVGCRWWSSKASTIPSKPTLTIPALSDRFIPRLEYRESFWFDAFDADWAVRNKSNASHARLDEARGGKVSFAPGYFVHTFNRLVPPGEYFATHPEWFSEINGERVGGEGVRSQLCLTNAELKDFVTERVLAALDQHPDANIISVSQNDWRAYCQCAQCAALAEHEGSEAGPLLHFVNYVAERVADKHPDVGVETLAYQYTRVPPRHVRPLPNVIIRLCSIECNFLEPLTHWSNASFRHDIEGWNEISDRLYIWDYVTNFAHYIQPHPNLRVLADNIRFFVEHGVKGIFEQGAYQSHGGEFAELKAWVLAKLLWEPYRDPEELIDQFVQGYYGPAGGPIREYINYLHDDAISTGHYLGIGSPPTAPFLTLRLMGRAEELFNEAEAAVQDAPELLNRVQVARLPIRYVWAMRWHEFRQQARAEGIDWPGPDDYERNARTFLEVAAANDIRRVSEGRLIDTFEKRTIGLGRKESPPPPGCENLQPGDFIDLQDGTFSLWREGVGATLTQDEKASDGVAARMPGDHHEWAVQQRLSVAGLDREATYTAYVSIRCEKTGDEGLAFSFGLYDTEARSPVGSYTYVQCEDVQDDEYHTYKVATAQLHGQMYLWVAPPRNPDNVKAVWVDRFWLVKEQ